MCSGMLNAPKLASTENRATAVPVTRSGLYEPIATGGTQFRSEGEFAARFFTPNRKRGDRPHDQFILDCVDVEIIRSAPEQRQTATICLEQRPQNVEETAPAAAD